jgi:hypothetical protein
MSRLFLYAEKDDIVRKNDDYIAFDGCSQDELFELAESSSQKTVFHVMDEDGVILATKDTRDNKDADGNDDV